MNKVIPIEKNAKAKEGEKYIKSIRTVLPQNAMDTVSEKDTANTRKCVECQVTFVCVRDGKGAVADITMPVLVEISSKDDQIIFKFEKFGVPYFEILNQADATHWLQNGAQFTGYWQKVKNYYADDDNGEQVLKTFTTRYAISGELPVEILEA